MKENINIKKIKEAAIIPTYSTPYAAGADLYACMDGNVMIKAHTTEFVHTGIALEIPDGFAGLIFARSGLACKKGLAPANKVGVIDSDYRGEVIVALHNHSDHDLFIESGERIAQLVITPYLTANFTEVDELNETDRGEGGFGSTGSK
ncbi:MAG: dUTP diphosphatase [Lachnospiraceae bacterium]|nr:dUTP diphosphatase [Lachnospiraceae bacterium]MDE6698705.1 dUTP diphosphatase [Lachnospiraceae bacterium]